MSYQSVTDRGLFDFMLAKSYAQKVDAMDCAVYLRKAHDERYKATEKDLADKAFDMVRADPDVKTALGLLQPPQKSASSAPLRRVTRAFSQELPAARISSAKATGQPREWLSDQSRSATMSANVAAQPVHRRPLFKSSSR